MLTAQQNEILKLQIALLEQVKNTMDNIVNAGNVDYRTASALSFTNDRIDLAIEHIESGIESGSGDYTSCPACGSRVTWEESAAGVCPKEDCIVNRNGRSLTVKLTGDDAEQAFAELWSNVQYDNLNCNIEVIK